MHSSRKIFLWADAWSRAKGYGNHKGLGLASTADVESIHSAGPAWSRPSASSMGPCIVILQQDTCIQESMLFGFISEVQVIWI